jgi:hypothetical protein
MTWNGPIRTLPELSGPDSPGAQPYAPPGPHAAWVNGGNANGADSTLGTLDTFALSLFAGLAGGVTRQVFATFDAVSLAVFGVDQAVVAASKTVVQAGTGSVIVRTGTGALPIPAPSSIVLAVDPTSNGSVQASAQGTGAILLTSGSGISQWLTTSGGQLHVGSSSGAFSNTPDSVQVIAASDITRTAQTNIIDIATTGNFQIQASAGEIDIVGANRVEIATPGVSIAAAPAAPNVHSILDLQSTSRGFLVPRMTMAQRNGIGAAGGSDEALLVYVTDITPGFYFWNGAAWVAASLAGTWLLGGNAIAATVIGGTTDNQDVHLISNNTRRLTILKTGEVGIGPGDPDPSAQLDVQSTTKGARPWPSMTTVQRDAIPAPALGLKIFNTDTNRDEVWNGLAWLPLALPSMSDGRDGPIHVTVGMSPYLVTTVLYPTTFVLDAGAVLDLSGATAGLLLCSVSYTQNGTVRSNGQAGNPASAPATAGRGAGLNGYFGSGSGGAVDASANGAIGPTIGGGVGGAGGAGSVNPGGVPSVNLALSLPGDFASAIAQAQISQAVAVPGGGGSGNAGMGTSGAQGGGIGGQVTIGAPVVVMGATAHFELLGGDGGAGDIDAVTGAGGGGGGGTATVLAGSYTDHGVTVNAAGGAGGTSVGGGAHDGSPGTAGPATVNVILL